MKNSFVVFGLVSLFATAACKDREFNSEKSNSSGDIASTNGTPTWWPVLNADGTESQLPYKMFKEYSANHCEFYVNAVATGSQYVYHGAGYSFFLSNIVVNKKDLEAQGTRIMNTGILVKYTYTEKNSDKPPVDREGLLLAGPLAGKLNEYELLMSTGGTDTSGKSSNIEIKSVSYFMDVLRSGGEGYVRLWLNDSDKAFTMASIFSNYKRNEENGSTSYSWLDGNAPSPVFAQKRGCVR